MFKFHNYSFVYLLFLIILPAHSNCQTKINFLNSNSRAMAMSGAFISVYDIDNSPLWNPSISILEKDRKLGVGSKYSHLEVDIIPAGLAIGLLALDYFLGDSSESSCQLWKAIGIFAVYSFRGYTYTKNKYQFYIKLNEDLFDYDLLDTKNFFDNSQSILAFSYQIGREFAVGASLNYYQTYIKGEGRKRGVGETIGLSYNALAVNQLSYGITYYNFPDNIKDVRQMTERLIDNSVNIGVSYHYNYDYLISLDIRDINHFNNGSFLEAHLGLEEKIFNYNDGKFFLREGGYFLNNTTRKPVYSFGLGYKSNLTDNNDDNLYNISLGIIVNRFIEKKYNLFFSTQINL